MSWGELWDVHLVVGGKERGAGQVGSSAPLECPRGCRAEGLAGGSRGLSHGWSCRLDAGGIIQDVGGRRGKGHLQQGGRGGDNEEEEYGPHHSQTCSLGVGCGQGPQLASPHHAPTHLEGSWWRASGEDAPDAGSQDDGKDDAAQHDHDLLLHGERGGCDMWVAWGWGAGTRGRGWGTRSGR